jgi:hypothetical protein
MSDKSTKSKTNVAVGKSLLAGAERDYFVPSLGRSVKAVDQADIEKQVKQVKKAQKAQEVGDADK